MTMKFPPPAVCIRRLIPQAARRRIAASLFLPLIAAVIVAGCSSAPEVTETRPVVTPAPVDTSSRAEAKPKFLPKPVLRDSLPPASEGTLTDYRSLLDRARLHIILASKALSKQDTLQAFRECELTASHLSRAGNFIEAENDSLFARLSQNLAGLYNQCSAGIPTGNYDLPAVALRGIFGESIKADTTDLSRLVFTPPPPTTIPLPLNEHVERNIVYFTTRARGTMTRWLERSGRFFPVMQPILKEEGAPAEIIYLSMIESGLNPTARSWAKCVGLWQFLKSTGESYGLRGDWFYDDRRNPEKATRAAARHLLDLYHRFDDWHLALAAYNCGAGRVERAIRASRMDHPSYWDIQPLLPQETQNYVPIFIAAAVIALNPEAYDFVQIDHLDPLDYESMPLTRSYQVQDLAGCAGVTLEEFQELNPHLLQSVTPAGCDGFEIRIPRGARRTFAERLKDLREVNFAEKGLHRVSRGETLAKVANRYDVSVAELRRANGMKRNRALKPGEMLSIPRNNDPTEGSLTALDNVRSTSGRAKVDPTRNTRGRDRCTITVDKGQTLSTLAAKHQCSVADLMAWNSLEPDDVVKAGMQLTVWVKPDTGAAPTSAPVAQSAPPPEPLQPVQARSTQRSGQPTEEKHRVRRGETLASIASAFNVTIDNLMAWNQLTDQRVQSGRVLKIHPAQGSVAGRPLYDSSRVRTEAAAAAAAPAVVRVDRTPNAAHVVRQGETLWKISEMYDVSPQQIREWNSLRNDEIRSGQKLVMRPTDPGRAGRSRSPRTTPKVHTVSDGEGLWSIAQKYHLSVDSLIVWNDLQTASLQSGQHLRLTANPATQETAATGAPTSVPETYTVERHDRLPALARRFGISVDQLRAWNEIKGSDIREGQVLRLRKPAAPAIQQKSPVRVQGSTELLPQSYTVESGETLYGIAKKLGVRVEDLQTWNTLQTNAIRAGQVLTWYQSH